MAMPRLIFVTGKGGTGKSTIASALALALSRWSQVTLIELDHAGSDGRFKAATGRNPTNPKVRQVDLRTEVESFIEGIVPLRFVARRMLQSRTFAYVTSALPGLEPFLKMERLRALTGEAALSDSYLIADGPATGGALELLSVPGAIAKLAPQGRLNRMARELEAFIVDPARFGVLLVAQPLDLAVREVLEASRTIRLNGINIMAALLNCAVEPLFRSGEVSDLAGLDEAHGELARRRRRMGEATADACATLERAGLHPIKLPLLFKAAWRRAELMELGGEIIGGIGRG